MLYVDTVFIWYPNSAHLHTRPCNGQQSKPRDNPVHLLWLLKGTCRLVRGRRGLNDTKRYGGSRQCHMGAVRGTCEQKETSWASFSVSNAEIRNRCCSRQRCSMLVSAGLLLREHCQWACGIEVVISQTTFINALFSLASRSGNYKCFMPHVQCMDTDCTASPLYWLEQHCLNRGTTIPSLQSHYLELLVNNYCNINRKPISVFKYLLLLESLGCNFTPLSYFLWNLLRSLHEGSALFL